MAETMTLNVRIAFKHSLDNVDSDRFTIDVAADGSDTILQVKEKIAAAKGGKLAAEHIYLCFGPNDKFIGRQYQGDPNVDDGALTLDRFSVLTWLKQFPGWGLTARLMPAAPLPPGVAISRAAALSEGKDPERELAAARAKGELLKQSQLPVPWGPKPHRSNAVVDASYQPQQYPGPLVAM